MGFFNSLAKPKFTLKEAAENAPELMGCYKIYQNGELKYVGKSGYSLRQRFIQYYDGRCSFLLRAKEYTTTGTLSRSAGSS